MFCYVLGLIGMYYYNHLLVLEVTALSVVAHQI